MVFQYVVFSTIARSFALPESFFPVPCEMRLVGPVVTFAGKLDLPAFHLFEQERGVAGFVEAVGGDEHPVIVVERPQAGIGKGASPTVAAHDSGLSFDSALRVVRRI